ncbi:MAG: hypothetical protein GZ091_11010 [Paludibacter sp.]|nr:hypothetical protein [Paludibacter sp.]
MNRFKLFKTIFLAITFAIGSQLGSSQTLIAGWDFQTTSNGGTAVDYAPNTPNVLVANFGVGTLFLDGSNGSSSWIKTIPGNEISAYSGCYLNAGPGFSTYTGGAAALGVLCGTNGSANGKHMVFKFSMTGKSRLIVNYIMQRSPTGFTSQTWDYSTDGITWTGSQTFTDLPLWSLGLVTLDTIKGLANAETAYLRMSPSGASEATNYNKMDNIQFNAYSSLSTGSGIVTPLSNVNISVSNGMIRFNANAGRQLEIYNAGGQILINKLTIEGLNTIPLTAKGLVIIKVDSWISKVIL